MNNKWPALFYVNSLYFQQWNSNWEIDFLNSSIDSKLGFLNVGLRLYFELFLNLQKYWKLGFLNIALVGPLNVSIFINEMKYWDFWMLAWAVLSNFSRFTEELENWNFWIPLTFKFCQITRTVFQAWYVCRRRGVNLWLNCQFSRKEIFILMQQICVSLSAGNTVSKLIWG